MSYIERRLTYTDVETSSQKTVHEAELLDGALPAVILGEPGMGKSAVLRSLAARDPRYEIISALKLKRRHAPVLADKILLVDGLDELPGARGQDPIQDVLAKLEQLGSPPFILSCRANDWRSAAKQSISEDYGRAPIEYRLEALTRADAIEFLADRHGDEAARRLVTRMDRQAIGEFYGNPLTLLLVDRLASTPQGLPQDRADLFTRASEALRQELAPDRDTAPLVALSSAAALDAIGAACAALILTGSEAINVGAQAATQDGDLHLSDVASLAGAAALPIAISSALFERREGQGDRLAPFHRAMAEFLGARWIARQATDVSGRRLLAMMRYEGGVPASVRGLHAWLAFFSPELRAAVIEADPYGVLRSGDAAYLTPPDARRLLRALERLSQVDPWFATGDDRQHRAPALTQTAMVDDLRRVLASPASAFQLKSILLLALPGSEAAPLLLPELEAILMSPGAARSGRAASAYSFHERAAAAQVLIEHLDRTSWSTRVEALLERPGEDDRRLAVELIPSVGGEHFSPQTIARAVLSFVGLLDLAQPDVSNYGDLVDLSNAINAQNAGAVLDAIADAKPAKREVEFRTSWELSGVIDRLLVLALPRGDLEPARVLRWLRLVDRTHRSDRDAQRFIREFFRDNVELRRALQREVVLIEARVTRTTDWTWSLADIDGQLGFTDDDLLAILTPENLPDLTDPHWRETFERLVAERRTMRGLPPAIAAAARRMASADVELEAIIDRLDQRSIPVYLRRDKIRRWRERSAERKRKAARQAHFSKLADQIAAGSFIGLSKAADIYLCRFIGLDREATPRTRLVTWIGEDLADQMLAGFAATFLRDDLPSPEDVGETHVARKFFKTTHMLKAGACERALAGRGFDDLPEDAVISAALGVILKPSPEGIDRPLLAMLEPWFAARPAAWERTWRSAIEPQLRARRDHVDGLHKFLRPTARDPRRARLAAEWLRRYPDLPPIVEAELLDALTREADWSEVVALSAARETLGFRDDDQRVTWLAVRFFADFAAAREALDAAAAAHPALFWAIRGRGWPADDRGRGRLLDVEPLAWLIRAFRRTFPCVERPTGVTSGDDNEWDAAEFLQAMIQRLATHTSDEAVERLATLRDESEDGYTPFLKNACAQQLSARRDAGFVPLSLGQLNAVLDAAAPTSPADLQALVLDALATVQSRMNRDAEGQVEMFYAAGAPKDEEACRDALVILLRDLIGHGVDVTSEHRMPGDTRADIVFSLNDLRLPLEAKGQWHAELWKAANAQLDAYYAIEWRARHLGIYLVFWFGAGVPENKALQTPGRGLTRPSTPDALREALIARVAEHRRGQIAVVVLDVSRRPGAALIPGPEALS